MTSDTLKKNPLFWEPPAQYPENHGAAMKSSQYQILQLLDLGISLAHLLTQEMTILFLPFCRAESAIGSGVLHGGTGKQSWLSSPCQPGMEPKKC